ncbi:MAG: MarR family transcriptional regulator [Myxococcota bacterium]
MPNPPDLERRRRQTQALVDLARIRNVSERKIEGWLAEEGLRAITPAQANALLVLVNARQPLSQVQLARALSLSEVTVGRFVRAMEDAGWVERDRDPGDARAYRIAPTARAREALPRFIAVSNRLLDEAFAGLDDASIDRVTRCIAVLRGNLDPEPPQPEPSGAGVSGTDDGGGSRR